MTEALHTTQSADGALVIRRHSLAVRITHWINVLCLLVLLLSGLQIFNAHSALYFGEDSDPERAVLTIGVEQRENGTLAGVTEIAGAKFDTTGFLGLSRGYNGEPERRAFPTWLTLPGYRDLATGRRWHFFFAWAFVINGLVYLLHGFLTRHVQRDLAPSRAELKTIGHSIAEHARLRFPKGEEARRYNVLQKLAYLGIIFVVLPVTILAGLTMSPALNAAFPFLLDLFGGRQSARTIHFIGANLIVLFVLVHVIMVLVSGVANNMRSMITGRYTIEPAERPHER
jgi:thiosulfate reductase cytochrome b subunit